MKAPASTETAPTDVAASSLRSTSTSPVVLESGSVDAIALNNSAVQLTFENRLVEAQALLKRAIVAQPQVAKFHRNLSIVFEKMKKNDDALASARTADRLSPTDPSVVERLCSFELDLGNAPVARECYERLNSIQPLDSLASTYYGIALFRSGKTDESIRVLEKAANSTPPIPVALNALGIAYFELNRLTQAERAFKNAVERAPETFHLRYNLAVTQLSLRNKEGALSQYKLLKTGDPKLAAQLYQMLFRDKIAVVPKN
jgi:tetratricopeptide (TPR) repeat protein